MSSIDPFNRLVKFTARAFYDDMPSKGENQQQKAGRSDNRGLAVVVLDALTRRQWVREEDLAKDIKLHTKQLRRTLRFLEEEKLITRDHRKETAKGAKIYNAAAAFVGDGQHTGREGEEKLKMHTHSYCCLDYSQLFDVVRYRLHRMRKKVKDELESRNTVQEYVCPNCNKRYTALDALRLVSFEDSDFHCESCNGVLVAESEKFGVQDFGDGDDNARRRRHEKLKEMLATMEEQLKPLVAQLARVKDLPVPEFGSLQAWELKANASGRLNGDLNSNDPSKSGSFGGHVPLYGDTKVEVAFSGIDDKGDVKSVKVDAPKVLPPWMIKQGMNITKEQRGETKPEAKIGGASTATEPSDDKKSAIVDDEAKKFQDEYLKAYREAYSKRQQETMIKQEPPNAIVERQVGVKSKRDYDDEGDDVEWEEDAPPTGGTSEQFKVNDLNVEAEPSEDEDDIDWEEG